MLTKTYESERARARARLALSRPETNVILVILLERTTRLVNTSG